MNQGCEMQGTLAKSRAPRSVPWASQATALLLKCSHNQVLCTNYVHKYGYFSLYFYIQLGILKESPPCNILETGIWNFLFSGLF